MGRSYEVAAEAAPTGKQTHMRHAGRITEWNDAKGYGFVDLPPPTVPVITDKARG
jgi:hypothetical protein